MANFTEAIRKHHRSLAGTLGAHARGLGRGEPQREPEAFVAFLNGDLLPHERATSLIAGRWACAKARKANRE